MKANKIIFTITVVIALLLTTLCGCEQTNNPKSDDELIAGESHYSPAPFMISISDDTNFKDEMINRIESSKTISKEDDEEQNNGAYHAYKFSEIKEFYSLDNLTIDGNKLFRIDVGEGGFVYRYATIEELEKEKDYWFSYDSNVKIIIPRYMVEGFDFNDPFRGLIEQAEEQGWEYLYQDGMFYDKTDEKASIRALMGDTFFVIDVRDELNSYEHLRDLAFKLIETAELVTVGE